jgi:hypothetical protein
MRSPTRKRTRKTSTSELLPSRSRTSASSGRADLQTLRILTSYQGGVVPTAGGLILFGKDRLRFFPDAWISVGLFGGADRTRILDSREQWVSRAAQVGALQTAATSLQTAARWRTSSRSTRVVEVADGDPTSRALRFTLAGSPTAHVLPADLPELRVRSSIRVDAPEVPLGHPREERIVRVDHVRDVRLADLGERW